MYFFHLWWNENLVKHQRVSIYYENDSLQNILLHYISLLTAKFVEKCPLKARIYFTFLENILKQTLNSFNTNPQHQWKYQRPNCQVGKVFALFCNLIALTLDENDVKELRVATIAKKIKFEGAWGK